jgi:SulP family sulfate permease
MNASFTNTGLVTRLFGTWLPRVNAMTVRADLMAGLLGAILVLPQAIAFATLAGLPPQYGFYTAIVPCVIAAVLGSSWHVVSGPTNANSLALFAMLVPLAAAGSPEYIELALAVTIMVGAMQWLIGALHLGSMANFISPSALLGFTGGAATLIAIHGLRDLLGLQPGTGHSAGATLMNVVRQWNQVQWPSVAVAAVTIAAIVIVRRLSRKAPAMVMGLLAATVLAWALDRSGRPVQMLGPLPSVIPRFHVPDVPWQRVPELLGLALSLTIVALGQSVSIAKAVAGRSGQHIDTNREFVGQGVSNVVGGLFSSYVSCGSLNRSMPNLEAGAQTPLAAVFAALLLLVLVAVSAPLLALIPFAGISALLMLVAWSLLDIPRWQRMLQLSRSDFAVAAATFVATISIRLEMAILIGTVLSLMTYLHRTSRPAMRSMGFDSMDPDRRFIVIEDTPNALPECPQLKLLRMEGSIYFGASPYVTDRLHELQARSPGQKHLLVMAKSMNFIDISGADLWRTELDSRWARGGDLYFHRPRPQVLDMWKRVHFIEAIGADHLYPDKRTAIADIFKRLDPGICARCTARIFWECGPGPTKPEGSKEPGLPPPPPAA